ncbi:ankyrin repeat domain-containing protein [Leeuwenhoekiella marinoflava]|uniref:Ankyrin repeat protein n=2 Tax=Leeuwenhoekiella marinoflava TaxID=988 RepID=A0A4Q0PF90_9FLAO|nr:ankyrin repeat domain-containing protein [Leeuwenhoekiella marinoflava]RXG25513.1 ankyrin repeat protein [Leeuwenhoekiella marinoflava]SHF84867.1 Ankyrin repeat [Leeuwenhoekiella marinoflava DSM 3653]
MKLVRYFFGTLAVFFSLTLNAQDSNKLLSGDFWSNKPSLEDVKGAVSEGNDPSELNNNNFDPVVLAILNDAPVEVVGYLFDQKGNSVNKLTHDGRTYIFWAAYRGNYALVKKFADAGAKMDLIDNHGYSVFNFAANAGVADTKIYDYLITKGSNPKIEKNHSGANALLLNLPSQKDFKMVDYFESKGLSLNDTDAEGNNAFIYTARSGNIEMMNTLIEKGIDHKVKNDEGGNAILFAAQGTRRGSSSLSVFKYLEDLGVEVNVTTKSGTNPLHILAGRNKDMDIFNYFLEKGVQPLAVDGDGNTPLIYAASRNDLEVVKLFEEKSKDINHTNKEGVSALTMAVAGNSPEVVSYLIAQGADAGIVDENGNTLMYYLVNAYNPRSAADFDVKMELLKNEGVDFAATQENQENMLLLAVKKNSLALTKKALDLDINVNQADSDGNTPLQLAALRADDTKILELLVSKGANTNVTTDFGESIYDLASENEILTRSKASLEFLK